ncbi:MAG: adenosylmethionine decarboxylase [bacterium]
METNSLPEKRPSETIGYHYIVEAAGCDPQILASPDAMREILTQSAKAGDMTVRTSYFYRFAPCGESGSGVSGLVIVAESHLSLHTWPEKGYAALDVFVCGEAAKPEAAIHYILESLGCRDAHVTEIKRGIQDEDAYTHAMVTWDETLKNRNP